MARGDQVFRAVIEGYRLTISEGDEGGLLVALDGNSSANGHAVHLPAVSVQMLLAALLDYGEAEHPFPYEAETCGTHHLIAERALRILESPLVETVDAATVEALRDLASEAGVAFARESLADQVPF